MFTLGVDFGTNSVRALVVRCSDGAEYGSGVVDYPSGAQGVLLDPKDGLLARQHPGDYVFGVEASIKGALAQAGRKPDFDPSRVIGIGVDSTGSSPIPVDDKNQPLASCAKWRDDLNAQCWLWKDHTSWREAAKITELSAQLRPQYIAKCGGVYSSEWFWAKLWHCLNVAPETFGAAFSWIELADWIPSVLAGVVDPRLVKRGVCAAGHKALRSTCVSPNFETAFTKRLTMQPNLPARCAPSGRRSLGSPRASRSRSANLTFTTARLAAACARARWSR
jgi:L-ribulokinase